MSTDELAESIRSFPTEYRITMHDVYMWPLGHERCVSLSKAREQLNKDRAKSPENTWKIVKITLNGEPDQGGMFSVKEQETLDE